ncbi:MAG: TetR/AcrR family transcriptional regulator [Planctomycetes bacterium]|nr:TetR/AcrR family transcriptional regulator [Planctomycetota bacterium]
MEGQSSQIYRELHSGKTARFDGKLVHLLTCAARIFAERGYEKASVRQVAQSAGFSLAGPYHYVSSKQELLFLIQYYTFGVLTEELEAVLNKPAAPESHLKEMVLGHVRYLADHLPELKVCTTALGSLKGEPYEQVLGRRQRYFELTRQILVRLAEREGGAKVEPNLAALYLFGMLNWIVMWFDPKRNDPAALSDDLVDLFLNGFRNRPEPAASAGLSEKRSN